MHFPGHGSKSEKEGFPGEKQSTQAPPPGYQAASSSITTTPPRTRFACLSFHTHDRIRFLQFTPEDHAAVRDAVTAHWPKGIKDERPYDTATEFKLHGYPWTSASTASDSVHAKRTVLALIAALAARGWLLAASSDVCKNATDKDSLLFRHQSPPPAPCEWVAIAFDKLDVVRFLGAKEEFAHAMVRVLAPFLAKPEAASAPWGFELKFAGYPWSAMGKDTMVSRKIMLALLEEMDATGWTVYGAVNSSNVGVQGMSEADTWHCCRPLGWNPSLPAYHR